MKGVQWTVVTSIAWGKGCAVDSGDIHSMCEGCAVDSGDIHSMSEGCAADSGDIHGMC